MLNNWRTWATLFILGMPFFGGAILILVSGTDSLADKPGSWDQIVPTLGAALMAAATGLFVSNINPLRVRIVPYVAVVAVLIILLVLYCGSEYKSGVIALAGALIGVLIVEVLYWLLRLCLLRRSEGEPPRSDPHSY